MERIIDNRKNRCLLHLKRIAALMLGIMLLVPVVPVFAIEEVTGEVPGREIEEVSGEVPGREIEEVSGEMSDRLRFVDLAGLVDSGITREIEEKLGEISTRQKMDIVIVTVNSLEGKTPVEFADDFYDDVGYGYFDSHDGILFLISMEDRDWVISTTGKAIETFTDAGQRYITDEIIPYISDGNYAKAFNIYAELCDDFITQAKKGEPYDVGHLPKTYFKVIWIPISLVIGFAIAAIMAFAHKSEMKSIVKQQSASRYTKDGSINMFNSQDRFINNIVTSRTISTSDSSGGGGGSTTHTSSSGTSHGGSSGKF